MAIVSKKRLSKIARQKLRMRTSLWPDIDQKDLWFYRERDGWLTIPRAMPLLMRIMDDMSIGKPISSTYFEGEDLCAGIFVGGHHREEANMRTKIEDYFGGSREFSPEP